MATPLTAQEKAKLSAAMAGFLPPPAAPVDLPTQYMSGAVELPTQYSGPAPMELPTQVIGPAPMAGPTELPTQYVGKGWLPNAPIANSAAEMFAAPAVAAPASPASQFTGALPAAPPVMGDASSVALLPGAPKPTKVDAPPVAVPKPVELAPQVFSGAPVGGPVASGGGPKGYAPASLGPPKPMSQADKEASVLLPGEKKLFLDAQEAQSLDEVWESAKFDKRIEGQKKATLAYEEANAVQEQLQEEQQKKDQQFHAYAENMFAARQALADEISNTKIDPARFWQGEAGVGRAIIAGVAGIFGVLGAPATGGKNAAVEEINKAIDRDINAQVHDVETKKSGLAAKQNEYGLRVKMFGDERAARASFMADSYRLVAKKIDVIAQQTSNEEQKLEASRLSDYYLGRAKLANDQFDVNLERMLAAKREAAAKAAAAAGASMQAKLDEERKYWRGVAGEGFKKTLTENPGSNLVFGTGGQPIGVVDPAGKLIYQPAMPGGGKGPAPINIVVGHDPTGVPIMGPAKVPVSPAAGEDYVKRIEALSKATGALVGMEALRKKNSGGALVASPEDKAKAKAFMRDLFTGSKTLGENSDKDAERILETLPDPLAVDPKASVMGGQTYTDALIAQHKAKIEAEVKRLNDQLFQGAPTSGGIPSIGAPVKAP